MKEVTKDREVWRQAAKSWTVALATITQKRAMKRKRDIKFWRPLENEYPFLSLKAFWLLMEFLTLWEKIKKKIFYLGL